MRQPRPLDAARAVEPLGEAAPEAERAVKGRRGCGRLRPASARDVPQTRPSLALAAQDALFWPDVEPFVNKPFSEVGAPPGYSRFERNGRTFLARTNADDALYPKLTVDEDGVIRLGGATSRRISKPGELAKALGPRPLNHEAHHLVPDAVVRDHPLFEAGTRGSPPTTSIAARTAHTFPTRQLTGSPVSPITSRYTGAATRNTVRWPRPRPTPP